MINQEEKEEGEEETNVQLQNNVPNGDVLTYKQKFHAAKEKTLGLTGDTITMGSGNKSMLWRVVENHISESPERVDPMIDLKPEMLDDVMKV